MASVAKLSRIPSLLSSPTHDTRTLSKNPSSASIRRPVDRCSNDGSNTSDDRRSVTSSQAISGIPAPSGSGLPKTPMRGGAGAHAPVASPQVHHSQSQPSLPVASTPSKMQSFAATHGLADGGRPRPSYSSPAPAGGGSASASPRTQQQHRPSALPPLDRAHHHRRQGSQGSQGAAQGQPYWALLSPDEERSEFDGDDGDSVDLSVDGAVRQVGA